MKYLALFISICVLIVSCVFTKSGLSKQNVLSEIECEECSTYFKNTLIPQIECHKFVAIEDTITSNCSFDLVSFVKHIPCMLGKKRELIKKLLPEQEVFNNTSVMYNFSVL